MKDSKQKPTDEIARLRRRIAELHDKELEREKKEKKKRLEDEHLQQEMRLDTISTLAGGIAHDFNNILMGIQGNVSLMYMDIDPSHSHYKRLQRIEKNIQIGAEIARQVLGFARSGRYMFEPTIINDIVKRTAIMFLSTRKKIKLHEEYENDIWHVRADHNQIEQLFVNLFKNAEDAMPNGGHIYLKTRNVVLDKNEVELFDLKPGRYVKVSVKDTGAGIDDKIKNRIFEPYFTTKQRHIGTGLGLAAAFGVAKGHGGMINVVSKKYQGALFNIYLPALNMDTK